MQVYQHCVMDSDDRKRIKEQSGRCRCILA